MHNRIQHFEKECLRSTLRSWIRTKITSKALKKNSLGQNNGKYVLGQVYSENCRTMDECREDPQEIPPLVDEDWHAVC